MEQLHTFATKTLPLLRDTSMFHRAEDSIESDDDQFSDRSISIIFSIPGSDGVKKEYVPLSLLVSILTNKRRSKKNISPLTDTSQSIERKSLAVKADRCTLTSASLSSKNIRKMYIG